MHTGRAARLWRVVVGVRWERVQSALAALYFRRVTFPLQAWAAFGRPPQFVPRLPWWQHLLWVWLSSTGVLRSGPPAREERFRHWLR